MAVTSVLPNAGPTGSAVPVRILGSGFQAPATVTFDGVALTAVVVDSGTITVTAPPHPEGRVDVIVTNSSGARVTLAGGYTYVPVAVTSVTPSAGFAGEPLTISGTGFLTGAVVTLDGIPATIVVSASSSSITATAPPHGSGVVDVVVINPGGQRGIPGSFIYATASVTVTPGLVTPGGQLRVDWTTQSSRSSLDWIGIFRAGQSNIDYLDYKYTNGATSGSQTWQAPSQPGQYEFRYLLDDEYTDVARSGLVTVAGAATTADTGARTSNRRAGRGAVR
jgi:hypothetical protein